MIKDFFLDKFKFDFENNKKFIECIEELDFEVSNFVIRSFSHIINVHHIWISRLLNNELESHSNDILPLEYWMRLAHDNYLKSIDYIEKYELESKVNYHDSENVKYEKEVVDILYHILNHSNYHRGQIAKELRDNGTTPPSFNFIQFH